MDALDGLIEPVEIPPLDLVGQPRPVRDADSALLYDQDVVGLLDAGLDG